MQHPHNPPNVTKQGGRWIRFSAKQSPTRALGFVRADGIPGVTFLAHGRAILGAGGTSLGRTVRAIAYIG